MGESLKDSFIGNVIDGSVSAGGYVEVFFDVEYGWSATVFLSGYSNKDLVEFRVTLEPDAGYMCVRLNRDPMEFDPHLWIEGKKRVCCRMYNRDPADDAYMYFSVSVKLYCEEKDAEWVKS